DRVSVTAHSINLLGTSHAVVALEISCSAGFFVRALAHDLGGELGIGAHLAALTRTRSGAYSIDHAVQLAGLEEAPERAAARALVPLDQMLPGLPALTLTAEGSHRTRHGRDLGTEHVVGLDSPERLSGGSTPTSYRLFDADGHLLGIAEACRT